MNSMNRLSDKGLQRLLNAARAISPRDADMMPDVIAVCEELQERRASEHSNQASANKEEPHCTHKTPDGNCELLSDGEVKQPCVEGPCPDEAFERNGSAQDG